MRPERMFATLSARWQPQSCAVNHADVRFGARSSSGAGPGAKARASSFRSDHQALVRFLASATNAGNRHKIHAQEVM